MPTEPATAESVRVRRVFRLAAGTALALWLSQAIAWPLSFVAPILAMVILSLPVSRPPAAFFVKIVVALVGSVYASFLFLPLLLHQRVAGLILVALALFHTFYLTARGKPAVVGTFITIGITVTVALGSVSVDVLLAVAEGLAIGALVGAAVAWLMHIVLPDPPMDRPPPPGPPPPPGHPVRRAIRSLVVVLPVTIFFLLSPASASNVGAMIKIASMGQEASGAAAGTAARSLLLSTVTGGFAAIAAWELLRIWPSLFLYTLLVAAASVWFAGRMFKGAGPAPDAGTWMYGLLTMLVILAPAVLDAQLGASASTTFYDRLGMFLAASAYGVGAVCVFDAFWPIPGERAGTELTSVPGKTVSAAH
ncbi:MAG TPA: DUF2955 domain-containing protein [Woeseiaceae bacterium]|nr:DUF2955 domain-containing protein [Woeseiaceae bacterium]